MVETGGVILIVDDDADYSCLMQVALHEAQITNRVEVLPDGDAAVTYLGQLPVRCQNSRFPALMLLDLKLPGLNGLEVLRWMREQPQLTGIPVILFTGSQDSQSQGQALALGAASLRVKPFSFNELVREVLAIRDNYLQPQEIRHAA